MISVEEAQRIILASVEPIGWEYVELLDSLGRVLAEDVTAAEPIPAWDKAALDGDGLRGGAVRVGVCRAPGPPRPRPGRGRPRSGADSGLGQRRHGRVRPPGGRDARSGSGPADHT